MALSPPHLLSGKPPISQCMRASGQWFPQGCSSPLQLSSLQMTQLPSSVTALSQITSCSSSKPSRGSPFPSDKSSTSYSDSQGLPGLALPPYLPDLRSCYPCPLPHPAPATLASLSFLEHTSTLLPQGLCTDYSLCLACTSSRYSPRLASSPPQVSFPDRPSPTTLLKSQ